MSSVVVVVVVGVVVVLTVVAVLMVRSGKRPNSLLADTCRDLVSVAEASEPDPTPKQIVPIKSFMVEADNGEPAFAMEALFNQDAYAKADIITLPKTSIDRLSPLMQLAPTALIANQVNNASLYEVMINGPLVAAKGHSGGFRAMTMGADGIKEHAVLRDPSKLQNLVTGAALFQIASVVVAQKHLADISRKLDEINRKVDEIKHFLDDERRSKITGALKYLSQMATPITKGELEVEFRMQLENIERDLLSVGDHLEFSIARSVAAMEALQDTEMFGVGDIQADIQKHLAEGTRLIEQWLLTQRARHQAWSLLTLYPDGQETKSARHAALTEAMEKMRSGDGPIRAMAEHLQSKVLLIQDRIFSDRTQIRADLKGSIKRTADDLFTNSGSERDLLARSRDMLDAIAAPTRLAIKQVDGKIVEVRSLAHDTESYLDIKLDSRQAERLPVL